MTLVKDSKAYFIWGEAYEMELCGREKILGSILYRTKKYIFYFFKKRMYSQKVEGTVSVDRKLLRVNIKSCG